ncbi:MAG: class I SAM-dependent methyltransferase [Actinomycetota bacterium]|nr:class I SAM-dependent methyltransferase [Actinomycetota bacterium]
MATGLRTILAKAQIRLLGRPAPPTPDVVYDPTWEPSDQPQPSFEHPISQVCTYAQMRQPSYYEWCRRLAEPWHIHRKLWEWCYIGQVCEVAGALVPGARGLGFGVGTEPLASYFASRGCQVVATDLPVHDAKHEKWNANDEHAAGLASLNPRGLCTDEQLRTLISFRPVDMMAVPEDLEGFDFVWSSCAFEHLGSLAAGLDFIRASLGCLKPGGVAVHTTEYNVSSNDETISSGETVAYRRRDMEELIAQLQGEGHGVKSTFALGTDRADRHVDTPPWSEPHLKIPLGPYVITSYGLAVTRAVTPTA